MQKCSCFQFIILWLKIIITRYNYLLDRVTSYWFQLQLKDCGKKFRVRKSTIILETENIGVGDHFSSMGSLYLYGNKGEITIGNNVAVNTNVQINASGGKIFIGNNVLIAANVVIRSSDHGIDRDSLIRKQRHSYGEIRIEDDVWIGSNVVITSNVTLAKGTVVGAGAVVTKSTSEYSIVGGVPAKTISMRK